MFGRVLMHCEYVGNFMETHTSIKKRRLIGSAKDNAIASIFDERLSCETFREKEAERLIKIGIFLFSFKYILYLNIHMKVSIKMIIIINRGSRTSNIADRKCIERLKTSL